MATICQLKIQLSIDEANPPRSDCEPSGSGVCSMASAKGSLLICGSGPCLPAIDVVSARTGGRNGTEELCHPRRENISISSVGKHIYCKF